MTFLHIQNDIYIFTMLHNVISISFVELLQIAKGLVKMTTLIKKPLGIVLLSMIIEMNSCKGYKVS